MRLKGRSLSPTRPKSASYDSPPVPATQPTALTASSLAGPGLMRSSRGDSAKFELDKLNQEALGREGPRGLGMKRSDLQSWTNRNCTTSIQRDRVQSSAAPSSPGARLTSSSLAIQPNPFSASTDLSVSTCFQIGSDEILNSPQKMGGRGGKPFSSAMNRHSSFGDEDSTLTSSQGKSGAVASTKHTLEELHTMAKFCSTMVLEHVRTYADTDDNSVGDADAKVRTFDGAAMIVDVSGFTRMCEEFSKGAVDKKDEVKKEEEEEEEEEERKKLQRDQMVKKKTLSRANTGDTIDRASSTKSAVR